MERVLESRTFARSERARNLLTYLVEQQLGGRAERLKGYSIAVDVFGKASDFDASTDAVVRVQAGRLRDLLKQYYADEGAADPLQIVVPVGSYVPAYRERSATDAAASPAPAIAADPTAEPAPRPEAASPAPSYSASMPQPTPSLRGMLRPSILIPVGLVVLVMVALAAFRIGSAGAPQLTTQQQVVDDITGTIRLAALPSAHVAVDAQTPEAARFAIWLREGISGFETIQLLATPPEGSAIDLGPGETHFIFRISEDADRNLLVLEVVELSTSRLLLARSFEIRALSGPNGEDLVAQLLTSLLPSSGRLYAFLAEINRQSPLVRCLFLNDQFYRNQNASTHLAAYTCLEELMEEGIALAMVYGELAALHMLAHAARYQYPEERSPQTAIRLARIASERGPGSPFAHRSMGFVLQRMGQAEEALPWMERAYELNRFDLTMAASLGYGLVFAGRYEEGTEMLRRAAQSSTVHPTWWNYGLFLGEFMLEQPEAAASAIAALRVSDRPHYLAARAIAAHMQGNREQTELLLTTLAERFPSFTADPLAFFAGANYPDDMAERLTVKLREVGLGATFGG